MKERNALVGKCIVSTALVTVLGSITLLKNPGYREYLELYIWFLTTTETYLHWLLYYNYIPYLWLGGELAPAPSPSVVEDEVLPALLQRNQATSALGTLRSGAIQARVVRVAILSCLLCMRECFTVNCARAPIVLWSNPCFCAHAPHYMSFVCCCPPCPPLRGG